MPGALNSDVATPDILGRPAGPDAALAPARWPLWLGVILAVAGLLRCFAIDVHSFWYDEAVMAELMTHTPGELLSGAVADNGNPPLYQVLGHFWLSIFGSSELALRIPSCIMGVAAVFLVAYLGRNLFGARIGLFAAALLAISPMAVELANEVRSYSLFLLLAIATTWFFIKWIETSNISVLACYSVSMALVLYTHYYAFALMPAHALTLAASAGGRRRIVPWLVALLVTALLCLPWAPAFLRQLATPNNLSRMASTWQEQFLATPLVFAFGRTLAWRDSGMIPLGLSSLAAVACFAAPATWGLIRLRSRPSLLVLLAGWLLIPTVGPFVAALCGKPLYTTRYATVALPAFLILVAVGFDSLRPAWKYAMVAIILTLTATSLARYASRPLKDDWRSATSLLVAEARPGALFVFDVDHEITSFSYYIKRFRAAIPATMIGITDGSHPSRSLPGLELRDGVKTTREPLDQRNRIFEFPDVWLSLCPTDKTITAYEELFKEHGYQVVKVGRYYRVSVIHFSRRPVRDPTK